MDSAGYLQRVVHYLSRVDLSDLPRWKPDQPFEVSPLAQGEYNVNYLLSQDENRWVVRVNLGTQIGREDQIAYEFRTLQLLKDSGVTPQPYFLDDSKSILDHGLLIMEYLPGEPLDYRRDLETAACLFARLHSVKVPPESNHLIREEYPLSSMYEECLRLASVYLQSELADPIVSRYLAEVLSWANEERLQEVYFLEAPIYCVVNTEVNSGNFIANREKGSLHLVDWEKPIYGDPSQDLSHFCAPTTTLWKTDYRMSEAEKLLFLKTYRDGIRYSFLRDTILERVRLRDPFNCLRGICWSAMAWVQYQTGVHALRNEDTFQKMKSYLEISFLRSLFDSYLK